MASEILNFKGYTSKTVPFKRHENLELTLDVLYPLEKPSSPPPVVIHYHGGFLVIGDRYIFFPSWLAQACVSRGWIFVTPDYRLIPETTAHSPVEDALQAYDFVLNSLSAYIGIRVGPVVVAGSSAGGFLALTTAALAHTKPIATLSVAGLLDMANEHYLTKGSNIFGLPVFDTTNVRESLKTIREKPVLIGYPYPADSSKDPRIRIVATFHIEALFPDYMTGVPGLSERISTEGVEAIPKDHRILYPLTFASLENLPPTILVHGLNDSAVPASLSKVAVEKLQAAGVKVHAEFPQIAEHGFEQAIGRNLEQEDVEEGKAPSFQSLRNALKYLDEIIATAETARTKH